MSNTKGKVNPSTSLVHRPDLEPISGNDASYSREHIAGPQKNPKPGPDRTGRIAVV